MKKFDIVIIGAGSIGLPLCYYLALKGKKVAVIDKLVSYGRGQNRAAIGGIRATHSDPAKITIGLKSLDIVRNFKKEHGLDIDWIEGGYLYPIYDEKRENALKKLLKTQKEFNLNIDWVDAEKVKELVPGINPENLRGGTYSPNDGSASPLKLAGAYYKLALGAGVEFFFKEEVIDFETKDNKVLNLTTNKDQYEADLFINASGGNARELGEMIGLDLPVYPDSHEAAISEPLKRFFEPMIVDIRPDNESANYYYYQNYEGQLVFCITPDPKIMGKDIDNTSSFLPLVVKRMLNLHPRLRNMKVRRIWRGLYPMTPDGFPIVGFPKEYDNMMLTVGMCGQGYMLGPGLGQILAEVIVDKSSDYNFILEQLTLYREFKGNELLK